MSFKNTLRIAVENNKKKILSIEFFNIHVNNCWKILKKKKKYAKVWITSIHNIVKLKNNLNWIKKKTSKNEKTVSNTERMFH